jgi:hypothetical protein
MISNMVHPDPNTPIKKIISTAMSAMRPYLRFRTKTSTGDATSAMASNSMATAESVIHSISFAENYKIKLLYTTSTKTTE